MKGPAENMEAQHTDRLGQQTPKEIISVKTVPVTHVNGSLRLRATRRGLEGPKGQEGREGRRRGQ